MGENGRHRDFVTVGDRQHGMRRLAEGRSSEADRLTLLARSGYPRRGWYSRTSPLADAGISRNNDVELDTKNFRYGGIGQAVGTQLF